MHNSPLAHILGDAVWVAAVVDESGDVADGCGVDDPLLLCKSLSVLFSVLRIHVPHVVKTFFVVVILSLQHLKSDHETACPSKSVLGKKERFEVITWLDLSEAKYLWL